MERALEGCRNGDAVAWQTLVEHFSRLVYSIPRRYKMNTPDCDDVHQAVFAALIAHLSSIKNAKALPAWLITTAHRECWRIGRQNSRCLNTDTDFLSVSEPQESVVEEVEERQLVRLGLDQLGGRCKELLLLLYGRTTEAAYDQVVATLGIPIGSIGPTRTRCMVKLSLILQKLGFSGASKAG